VSSSAGVLSLRYRLKAIPQLARPSSQRMRRFLAWETRGQPLGPASTHHGIPTEDAPGTLRHINPFLASEN
jgi:hypothetical protein